MATKKASKAKPRMTREELIEALDEAHRLLDLATKKLNGVLGILNEIKSRPPGTGGNPTPKIRNRPQ